MEEGGKMDLPAGFRFHPTDEELISHYLYKKVTDTNFSATAIGDVDLNRSEPWDLPWKAKMGEKEWYFFCVRDRKYPTGLRTNRATEAGYWKATGKDKEIYKGGRKLVGMKKTLVFYKGRAPKGVKTDWVMHEFRLEGTFSLHNLPKTAKNEWVICRVFQKSSVGKKTHISFGSSVLLPPPLSSDSSPSSNGNNNICSNKTLVPTTTTTESVYVPCFSNPIDSFTNNNNNNNFTPFGVPSNYSSPFGASLVFHSSSQGLPSNPFRDFEMGRRHFENHHHPPPPASAAPTPLDLASVWNY